MNFIRIAVFIFICFVAFSFMGCNESKKDGNVTLNIVTKYGDQNFALNTEVTDLEGRKLKFERFQFYMSHITLIKNDNSEVEVKDVALVDLTDPSTMQLTFNNFRGDFKGIKFGAGLDSTLNETDPLSVPAGSSLSYDRQMYWSWLKYIFAAVEGKFDTTGSASPTYDLPLVYHIGGNNLFREAKADKSFSVCCENTTNLTLTLDVKKIYYGDLQTIDIVTEGFEQSEIKSTGSVKFADNFSKAFTLN